MKRTPEELHLHFILRLTGVAFALLALIWAKQEKSFQAFHAACPIPVPEGINGNEIPYCAVAKYHSLNMLYRCKENGNDMDYGPSMAWVLREEKESGHKVGFFEKCKDAEWRAAEQSFEKYVDHTLKSKSLRGYDASKALQDEVESWSPWGKNFGNN